MPGKKILVTGVRQLARTSPQLFCPRHNVLLWVFSLFFFWEGGGGGRESKGCQGELGSRG